MPQASICGGVLDHGSDEGPNHVPQEPRPFDLEYPFIGIAHPSGVPNRAHSVGFCATAALKCPKVVLAKQACGHFVQKLPVQRAFAGPRRVAPKRGLRSLNAVAVAPTLSTKPRMKFVGSRNRLKEHEVVGQKAVEPKYQLV